VIRIRHCGKPYQELELEGSSAELSELRSAILGFCETEQPAIDVPARSEWDPSPDQHTPQRLRLCKTSDRLLVSVAEGQLFISGKLEFLRLFANKLPCSVHHISSVPCHLRFSRLGLEDRISEASLDVVLSSR
jgi:hypothetical protein